jgi:hypothetical protein
MDWSFKPQTAFSFLADDWNALNRESANSPMLDAEFVSDMLKYFGEGNEMLAVCQAGGKLAAVAVLSRTKLGWETFAPAQAVFGSWLLAKDVPLVEALRSLANSLPGFALSFGVSRQDPALTPRPQDGNGITTLDYITTGRVSAAEGFDAYWALRGKNLKHNSKRQRNGLARNGVATRLETIRDPSAIGGAVNDYATLESKGWKGKAGTALHPDNEQGKFYRAVFENLAARNEAVVYRYFYGDALVAVDLCVHRDGVLTILKTTHDEQQTSSPALLMREESLRAMFDHDGIERVEFYGKRMDWHTKWTDDFRTMYHVTVERWPWLASMLKRLRRPPVSAERKDT